MICSKCGIHEASLVKNGLKNGKQMWLLQCKFCRAERMRKARENNPKKYKEHQLKFQESHPWIPNLLRFDKKTDSINFRAKRNGIFEKVTKEEIANLYKENISCYDCGIYNEKLTIGHIIPLFYPIARNHIDFIILQCHKCNVKQNKRIHIKAYSEELSKYYRFYDTNNVSNLKLSHFGKDLYNVVDNIKMQNVYLSNLSYERLNNISSSANEHAKKYGNLERITLKIVDELFINNEKCIDCGSLENLTLGHAIPLFYPLGKNIKDNLIVQCRNCNSSQAAKIHYSAVTDELKKWYPIYKPKDNSSSA